MSKKKHQCVICGMPAKSKLHVEPEVGHIYICNDTDCRGAAVRELAERESQEMNQGRRPEQIEYAEKAGAVTLIIMIAFVVGYLVSKFLRQL